MAVVDVLQAWLIHTPGTRSAPQSAATQGPPKKIEGCATVQPKLTYSIMLGSQPLSASHRLTVAPAKGIA